MTIKTAAIEIRKDAEGVDRQVYRVNVPGQRELIAILTTDTVTVLGKPRGRIKYRGQISTEIAEFFLNATSDIVPNFLIDTEDCLPANMLLGDYCRPLSVKFITRRYLTGSLYEEYLSGDGMTPWGRLEDGLPNYHRFHELQLTPMVKIANDAYAPISEKSIVECGMLNVAEMKYVRTKCLELFMRGEFLAAKVGLTLADTKFEFGWNVYGGLVLIDELLTPDVSRYWQAQDKPYSDENPPEMEKSSEYLSAWVYCQAEKRGAETDEIELTATARREAYYSYLEIYRQLFGFPFSPVKNPQNPERTLRRYLESCF